MFQADLFPMYRIGDMWRRCEHYIMFVWNNACITIHSTKQPMSYNLFGGHLKRFLLLPQMWTSSGKSLCINHDKINEVLLRTQNHFDQYFEGVLSILSICSWNSVSTGQPSCSQEQICSQVSYQSMSSEKKLLKDVDTGHPGHTQQWSLPGTIDYVG